MHIGITIFLTNYTIDIVTLARHMEKMGFESLWVPEHPVIPAEMRTPWPGSKEGVLPDWYKRTIDPFVGLAAAAGATTKLKLGTGICLVPERNPLYTAKEVATLDQVSKGRFLFGIGAGWLREESELFGVDFPRRWTQTREHVMAMKALWNGELSEYSGKYVRFPKLWCHPKPVQKPHPPILIAGELDKAAQRVADFGDGWFPRGRAIDAKGVEQGRKKIEALYRERGRDPKSITISIFGADADKASNKSFADAGAERVIHMIRSEDEKKSLQTLEKIAGNVL